VSRRNSGQALMNDQDALRARAGKLAAESAAASDATSWFELLYQAAARGEATIPWASLAPNPHLVQWARARSLRGTGRTALVAGGPWAAASAPPPSSSRASALTLSPSTSPPPRSTAHAAASRAPLSTTPRATC